MRLLKFKFWLIRKLGGYTEQIHVTCRENQCRLNGESPILVKSHKRISGKDLAPVSTNAIDDSVKEELIRDLANYIFERDLVKIIRAYDPYTDSHSYNAELYIFNPVASC